MRAFNRYIGLGLATFSGCLWFIACPPFDLSILAWVAAVPMLLAIDRAPNLRTALFLGWWAGVVETGGGFYWLIDFTHRFAEFPWAAGALVLLLFSASRALIFLLFTAVVYGIRRRRNLPMAVLAPLAMVGCEFVIPQVFTCGQWVSQAWHPLVIQIAELTGPWGVTALLMLVNGALLDLCVDARAARYTVPAAVALLAAALIFGAVRMRQVDADIGRAPRLSIGLVQPNYPYANDTELSRDEAVRQLTALQEQSRRLERAGAQLAVWSEGSYPVALGRDFNMDYPPESLGMIRRDIAIPLIVGTDTYDPDRDKLFNSALLLDTAGRVTGRYDKVRLLAFGEYVPGADTFPWLRKLLPATGRFTPGAGPRLMAFPAPGGQIWQLGPVICYEDLLPDFLRELGRLHPDVLVNLTVDSWYGAFSEPWEHLALSVFSTVELRVALVRAVNSGVSVLVDPNGRLLEKTYANDPYREPRAADGIVVSVPKMTGGRTLYVAWGDWFAYLCVAAAAAISWSAYRRGARAHEV
jgi:apolipoprotein N-acyltransferase